MVGVAKGDRAVASPEGGGGVSSVPACPAAMWPCLLLALALLGTVPASHPGECPPAPVSAPHSPAHSQGHPGDTLSPCHPSAMTTDATCLGLVVGGRGTPGTNPPCPAASCQLQGVPAGGTPKLRYTVVKSLRTYSGAQVRGCGVRGVPALQAMLVPQQHCQEVPLGTGGCLVPARACPTALLPGGVQGGPAGLGAQQLPQPGAAETGTNIQPPPLALDWSCHQLQGEGTLGTRGCQSSAGCWPGDQLWAALRGEGVGLGCWGCFVGDEPGYGVLEAGF